jgi:hypothetical protein
MNLGFDSCQLSFEVWFVLFYLISLGGIGVSFLVVSSDDEATWWSIFLATVLMAFLWPFLLLIYFVLMLAEVFERVKNSLS